MDACQRKNIVAALSEQELLEVIALLALAERQSDQEIIDDLSQIRWKAFNALGNQLRLRVDSNILRID